MMSDEWSVGGMYHTCRWCKNFEKGCCTLGVFRPVLTDSVYTVAEDGGLSAVIEETLNSLDQKYLMQTITEVCDEQKISRQKKVKLMEALDEALRQFFDFTAKEALDDAISRLYQERLDNATVTEEVEIQDPHTFYCKEFF